MAYTLINHLDNYAKLLKCLNDQGGMETDYYDVTDSNKLKTFTFSVAFKNPPMYINPTPLHYESNNRVTFPRVLRQEVTNINFKVNHIELNGTEQMVKISYIAVGV